MTFVTPDLPYWYDALEPTIDKKTMQLHHDKHHATYVAKLNAAIEWTPFAELSLEDLLQSIESLPDDKKTAVRNNWWGHRNHSFFREIMTPWWSDIPSDLMSLIVNNFWSFDNFKEQFINAWKTNFWSWRSRLVQNGEKLGIENTDNQDSPIMENKNPIMWIDVREHAYYLQYQNRRPDYIANWLSVVNRDKVQDNLQ